jgi:hypothetical protein
MAKTKWATIHLTSPPFGSAKGTQHAAEARDHVKTAQYLLQHNRFDVFMDGGEAARDGIYGRHTASSVAHAKHMLGFRRKHVNNQFGQTLFDFLVSKNHPNHRKLPFLFRYRRLKRLRQANQTLGQKALIQALSQVGVREYPPESNRVKYSEWYGMIGAWCAMFESWCFWRVGGSFRYSYVPNIHSDASNGYHGLRIVRDPEPGDVVCYSFTTRDQHTGFFHSWIVKGNSFWSVDGNTSSGPGGSEDNGGIVAKRQRYISNVSAFVRVTR